MKLHPPPWCVCVGGSIYKSVWGYLKISTGNIGGGTSFQTELFAFWNDVITLDYVKITLKIQCFLLVFIVQNTPYNRSVTRFRWLEKGLEAFLSLRDTFLGKTDANLRENCIIPLHFIKSHFQHSWMLYIEFWRIFLEISCVMVSDGSYRCMCWWKRAIQCSKWIWASFCILFHTFKCTGAKIRW